MTKELSIQKAYGRHWRTVKESVDENGWITSRDDKPIFAPSIGELEEHPNRYAYRPKSLIGIENNAGWTKIESEADLPKDESKEYKACKLFDSVIWELMKGDLSSKILAHYYFHNLITHYKEIELTKPIY